MCHRKNSAISPCYRQQNGPLPFVYFSILDTGIRGTEVLIWTVAGASNNSSNQFCTLYMFMISSDVVSNLHTLKLRLIS